MTIKRTLIFAALSVVSSLLGPGAAYACSCRPDSGTEAEQVAEALKSASVVFLGRITSSAMESWQERMPLTEVQKTKFRVTRQWKGVAQQVFELHIDVQCCVCGYEFPKTGEFLVYASGPDAEGYFQTNICTRTKPASEAMKEIEILDELTLRRSAGQ